jgi:hypothetical protein
MLAPGLSVRIDDGLTSRDVSRHCAGLRFTKVASGGHQMIQCPVSLPHETFPNLGPNDLVTVTDQATARIVIDGYLKNPTPVDGPTGQYYDLTALGGMWRASDESRPLVYVDSAIDGWEAETNSSVFDGSTSGSVNSVDVAGNPGLRLAFPSGQLVATNTFIAAGYRRIAEAGMALGGVHVFSGSGKDDAGYRLELYADGSPAPGLFLVSDGGQITTVPADQSFFTGDGYPRSTDAVAEIFSGTRVAFQVRRIGAPTNVADEETYSDLVVLSVIGQRMDRYGVLYTGAVGLGTAQSVYAHQVVEDLLGRVLTMCDPATAVIEVPDGGGFAIDQLAYVDGTKAGQVLTDLMVWESEFTWEIGERLSNGLHRFGWRRWPISPRYVVSTADGWVQTGSDQNTCNRVLVTWTGAAGAKQSLVVTAQDLLDDGLVTAADLDGVGDGLTAGQIRDADRFTLPDGLGSLANAARIGRGVLLDTIKPPRAGKVTIRGKVLDLLTGNRVWPWELEPGYVCRVREKGYDLRITQADYDHAGQEMTLTLGTPVKTPEERLARLDAA